MSQYRYQALNRSGQYLQGWVEAATEMEAIARVQAQGHILLQATAIESPRWWRVGSLRSARAGLNAQQRLILTQQLATLLQAGQTLDRALGVLIQLQAQPASQDLLRRLQAQLRSGRVLSAALADESAVFPAIYVSVVRAGEAGGVLANSLAELADYLERQLRLQGHLINALIYPAFLLTGVLASLVLLLTYVVPQFVPIFADMQVELPWMTRLILSLGQAMKHFGWLIIVGLGLLVMIGLRGLREDERKQKIHALVWRLRGIGHLVQQLETARFCRSLGTLLQHGVSLLTGLQIAMGVVRNHALLRALQQVVAAIRDGARLGHALAQTKMLPLLAVQMVQVGEETGELGPLLLKVATMFEVESQRSMDRLLAALVPSLTLLMTALVAFIMAAILLPLLSLTSQIQ